MKTSTTSRDVSVRDRPEPARVAIVVVGMHRSGTSAVTRVLSLLGAALPKNLLGAGKGNEEGHWEPSRLVVAHDLMLDDAGSSWDDWRADPLAGLSPERLAHHRREIETILSEEYGQAPLLVLKEPRICRFVPFYQDILAGLGIAPRYVLPVRNPLAAIASLKKRDGMTEGFAAMLWLRHVLDAEAATRGASRVFVSYENMLDDWRGAVGRIVGGLDVDWPNGLDAVAPEIGKFLSRDLQHQKSNPEELRDSAVSGWVKDCYAAVCALADGGKIAPALAEFDRVRAAFDAACAALGDAALVELHAERKRALATNKALAETTHARNLENQEAAARLSAAGQELAAARQAAAAELEATRQAAAAELEATRQAAAAERAAAQQAAEGQRAAIEELRLEIAGRNARVEQLVGELTEARLRAEEAIAFAEERARKDEELRGLAEAHAGSTRALEQAGVANAELRHALDAVLASRSWRYSAWLRGMTTAIGRVGRAALGR
jgi:hypothetical protein